MRYKGKPKQNPQFPQRYRCLTFVGLIFFLSCASHFEVGHQKVQGAIIVILERQSVSLLEQDGFLIVIQIKIRSNEALHNLLVGDIITALHGNQFIVTVLNGREGNGLRRGGLGGQKGHVAGGISVGLVRSELDDLELVGIADAQIASQIAANFGSVGGNLLGLDGGVRGTTATADNSYNLTGLDLELLGLLGGDINSAVGLGANGSLLCVELDKKRNKGLIVVG